MAGSLMNRCIAKTVRSFYSAICRSSVARLSTKHTDGNVSITEGKSDDTLMPSASGETALSGFAKALDKARAEVAESEDTATTETVETEHKTFAAMLRYSKLMQLGDFSGRMMQGTIFDVVGDDLYIDLGGKFHCVCQRPQHNSERYHRGVKVKVQLNDPEMSSSFLGSEIHVTLLEADGTLIGLRREPFS